MLFLSGVQAHGTYHPTNEFTPGNEQRTTTRFAGTKKAPLIDACCVMRYTPFIIKDFKHKGLEKFFTNGSTRGIQANHSSKLRMQLAMLDASTEVDDMDKPGWNLHQLKGRRACVWSIKISGNWRVTFRFKDGDAYIVNYEDYH